MILVRIARIIHAIICVAAFMVFVNHGSAQESDPSETVQTDVPSTPADLSRSTGSDCAAPVEGSQAIVFAPPQTSEFARGRHVKRQDRASEGRSAISTDPTPTLQRDTGLCTLKAAERYRRIADNGGWVRIPKPLRQGASADDVKRLRQRLTTEGDLPSDGSQWDEALTEALKRFQRRAGLQPSGEVDEATLKALNVPADARAHELESSAKRVADLKIQFDQPYVVVNIPTASVEAVENQRVVQRHTAIAGKRRRTRRKIGVPFSPLKMRLMGFVSLTAEFFNGFRHKRSWRWADHGNPSSTRLGRSALVLLAPLF
jgi:hypothetical protein